MRAGWVVVAVVMGLGLGRVRADPDVPPEIEVMIDKVEAGTPLTATEMKALQDFFASKLGAVGGAVPGANAPLATYVPGGADGGTLEALCTSRHKTALAKGPALTAKGYAGLLAALAKGYARPAGPRLSAWIERQLRSAKDVQDGANLGAVLAMAGNEAAAIVATVASAKRAPTDPGFVSNLGAYADRAGADALALQLLEYATTLDQKHAAAFTNLGWLHLSYGDTQAAKAAFQRALSINKLAPGALAGHGTVLACEGDLDGAHDQLTRSIAQRFSSATARTLQRVSDARAQRDADRPPPDPATDPSRDPSRAPPSTPRPRAPTAPIAFRVPHGATPPVILDPFMGTNHLTWIQNHARADAFGRHVNDGLLAAATKLQTATQAFRPTATLPPARTRGTVTIVYDIDDRRHSVLFDIVRMRFISATNPLLGGIQRDIFQLRIAADEEKRRIEAAEDRERAACSHAPDPRACATAVRARYCPAYRELGKRIYEQAAQSYAAWWPHYKVALEDLWWGTEAVSSMTTEPRWAELYSLQRQGMSYKTYLDLAALLQPARTESKELAERNCAPSAATGVARPALLPFAKPGTCEPVSLGLNAALGKSSLLGIGFEVEQETCTEVALKLQLGPVVWRGQGDLATREFELFVGTSLGESTLAGGVELKTGYYVSGRATKLEAIGFQGELSGYSNLHMTKGTVEGKINFLNGIDELTGESATGVEVGTPFGGGSIWTKN